MYNSNLLFEDPYFPANNQSLFPKTTTMTSVIWMRPKVIPIDFIFVNFYEEIKIYI